MKNSAMTVRASVPPFDLNITDEDYVDPYDAPPRSNRSDGSSATYYQLPPWATELQDLISEKNMNAQIGEIFRSCFRYGEASHSDQLRDAKKIQFYINAEVKRLERGQ